MLAEASYIVIFQVLIQWLFCKEKKIVPSFTPIYSKLKKENLVIKKARRSKHQIFNKSHVHDQPNNFPDVYLMFIKKEAEGA